MVCLRNHRHVLVGMGSISVPTVTFRRLQVFFVIHRERGKLVQFIVTELPIAMWNVQQLREAFPFDSASRFAIFDRDRQYGNMVPLKLKSMNITLVKAAPLFSWQNGIAERWMLSVRQEVLNHVVVFDEPHLCRLLSWCV